MAKYVRLDVREYDKLINKFGNLLIEMYKDMNVITDELCTVIKGDGEGAYWSGASAKRFYKNAKTNIDKNIDAYDALYRVYEKLVMTRAAIARKGYDKE